MRTRAGILALLMIATLAACGGGGGDSDEQVAKFCREYDNIEIPADPSSPNDLDGLKAKLDAMKAQMTALEQAAPSSLKDEFETVNEFQAMTDDQQYVPANRKAYNEANDAIDEYVKEECELN